MFIQHGLKIIYTIIEIEMFLSVDAESIGTNYCKINITFYIIIPNKKN